MANTSKKKSKKRVKVKHGVVHIQSTYNNTLISVTNEAGDVLVSSSSGRVGFTGTRKATPYAGQQAVANLLEQLQPYGMEEVDVIVKGIGSARESIVRAISASGMAITSIQDKTPIPHNGVRPPKRRRV